LFTDHPPLRLDPYASEVGMSAPSADFSSWSQARLAEVEQLLEQWVPAAAPAAVTVRRVVSERVCLSQNVWTEPCAIHSMCYLYEVRELVTSHY